MNDLIYLSDDVNAVVDRILNDKELKDCGLTKEKVLRTLKSFGGDEIACSVFYKKYALKDDNNNILELTLNESKDRWAKAIVEAETFEVTKGFDYFRELYDYMLPAGRQMYALGNKYVPKATYTNCYVLGLDDDSIEGIYETAKNMAKTYSYGGGVGICIGNLRPLGAKVSNSAKVSTGAVSFMELYSNTTGVIGQCIAKGEKVLTARGLVNIEDVIPNKDSVWTKEGFIRVIKKFNNGIKKVYKIKDYRGFEIKASMDHVFVTALKDGGIKEQKLSDFSIGDDIVLIPGTEIKKEYVSLTKTNFIKKYVGSHPKKDVILPEKINEDFAYLLGYSYGDGSVEFDKFEEPLCLSLCCSWDYPEIQDKLYNICKETFNIVPSVSKGDGELNNLDIRSKELMLFLSTNGILKQKCGKLVFPENILNSPSSVQLSFISGYLDADGSVGIKKGYTITSVDLKFLSDVKQILIANGIASHISLEPSNKENWKDKERISICGTTAQNQFVRLSNSMCDKVDKFNYISKQDNYITPFKAKNFNIKHNKHKFLNGNDFLSMSAFCKAKNTNDYDLHYPLIKTQVKEITFYGEEETFDLQLEKEHLFYCQGYLVHNSGRRGALMISMPVDHPDIEDFIDIKNNNVDKVKNANISVKITDEFMNAVIEDKEFNLTFETKHEKISKTVRAKDLWNKIITSAHNSAEPGVLFWTQAQNMSPSDTYDELKIRTTNPCLTGDTLVCVADERKYVSFEELVEIGKDVVVFCLNEKNNIVKRTMRNPRETGVKEVYKMELSNGCYFKATINHKFMNANGEYIELRNFNIGDELKCFVNGDNTICKIINKEYIGTESVFNGTVDEFHNYLITHEKNESFQVVSKNCGEQLLEGFQGLSGNCNLASILLDRFVEDPFTENAKFNYEKFKDIVTRSVRHLDNIIEINDGRHALEGQNKAAKLGRRLGLGFTGLADTFVALGFAYDSEEALKLTEEIMKVKMEAEYNASIDLAGERGSFPLYDSSKHFERGFCNGLSDEIKNKAKKIGLRNVAISTIAPSGSISIIAQCSSGIEPIFALSYKRYTQLGGNERKEFTVYHQAVNRFKKISGQEELPEYWKVAHQIDYNYRVKLQGVLQRYIDASISSTINLPSDVSVETVGQIYIDAWREGLKGITVYREGSREGILITDDFAKKAGTPIMDSVTYKVRAEGGDKFYVIVSYKNKNVKEPYQVFVLNYKQGDQDSFVKIGNSLMKMLKSSGVSEERLMKYSNRSKTSLEKLTRFLSLSMKTGNLEGAVEILNEHAFVGTLAMKLYEIFSKSVDAKKGLCKNPDCKSSNVRMEEGCMHCLDCGWSGCN